MVWTDGHSGEGTTYICIKGPRVVLQPQHPESLTEARKGSLVETVSTEFENEVDEGGEKDVSSTTFDSCLRL